MADMTPDEQAQLEELRAIMLANTGAAGQPAGYLSDEDRAMVRATLAAKQPEPTTLAKVLMSIGKADVSGAQTPLQGLSGVVRSVGTNVPAFDAAARAEKLQRMKTLLPFLKQYAPSKSPILKPGEKTILEAANGDMTKMDKLLWPYANYPVSMTDELLRVSKPKEFAPAKPARPEKPARPSAAGERADITKKQNIQAALGDIMSRTPAIVVKGGKEVPGPAKSLEDIKNMVRIRYKLDPDVEPEIKEALSHVQYFAPWLGTNYYQYVPPESKPVAPIATPTGTTAKATPEVIATYKMGLQKGHPQATLDSALKRDGYDDETIAYIKHWAAQK